MFELLSLLIGTSTRENIKCLLDNLSKFNSLVVIHFSFHIIWIKITCFMTIGQVGAIRLGISRALQNWEPDLRPALRSGMNFLCFYVDLFFYTFFRVSLLLMSVLYMFCCYDESLNYFFLLNLTSRLPNKGFKSGWKEKTRKGQSKKELPMGQALKECHCLDGNFCFEYWRSSIT
jgi:hypothetical protein